VSEELDKFIIENNGIWPAFQGDSVRLGALATAYFKCEFEKRSKELGFINGYRWGVEYLAGFKKPKIDDDVILVVNSHNVGEFTGERAVRNNMWNLTRSFKITDPRYKPADTSYLQTPAVEPAEEVAQGDWWDYENHCIIDEQCPPIGSIIELRERSEFLSLASGEITYISAGAHCHVVGHAERPDNKFKCVTLMSVINIDAGFCTGNPTRLVKPLDHATRKAELEKKRVVDAAMTAVDEFIEPRQTIEALYDLGWRPAK